MTILSVLLYAALIYIFIGTLIAIQRIETRFKGHPVDMVVFLSVTLLWPGLFYGQLMRVVRRIKRGR